jgi:LEA14-like dessication related protein
MLDVSLTKMRKSYLLIPFTLISIISRVCVAQGPSSLYAIIDPFGKYANVEMEWLNLQDIIGETIKDIQIVESHGKWRNITEPRKQLLEILKVKNIEACSLPLWNLDFPVELIGLIKYSDGSEGKVAICRHRVGFQDKNGKPWYFQWEEGISGK